MIDVKFQLGKTFKLLYPIIFVLLCPYNLPLSAIFSINYKISNFDLTLKT